MERPDVFICHRRDDALGQAGRIYFQLKTRVRGRVFIDTESSFDQLIQNVVKSCQVFVVIIGRNWLTAVDSDGNRRIDQANDPVRQQVTLALQSKRNILPLLVEGAQMPDSNMLPADIAQLCRWQAYGVTNEDFDLEVQRVVLRIESALKETVPVAPPPAPPLAVEDFQDEEFATETDLVFICYAREDEEFTIPLAKTIKLRGVRVWLDQWDIPVGADWDLAIDDAISRCSRLLIVLSPVSVNSPDVRSELRAALDQEKPVVPVLYQKCKIPRRLSLTQFIDFMSVPLDDEEKMAQLLRVLRTREKAAHSHAKAPAETLKQSDGKALGLEETDGEHDELFKDALRICVEMKRASTSVLQRRLRIGYGQAAAILEIMEREGLIGQSEGSRPRPVLGRAYEMIAQWDESGEEE